jgi:putative glycerol-1-phosphate prenyltransferase
MNSVWNRVDQARLAKHPLLAVLIDPGKLSPKKLQHLLTAASVSRPDFFFIGGSTADAEELAKCIADIDAFCEGIPKIIFPGNEQQINAQADAFLLLSLVSGRNPDLLIGKHVTAAKQLKKSGLEIIPTAYLLIDGGTTTTVAYLSQTQPIPREKFALAVSTALAAELLGMRFIYLEAGSGAKLPVPPEMIHAVKLECQIPVIVGGGIDSTAKLLKAMDAGADMVVVGNALEKNPDLLHDMRACIAYSEIK